MRISRRGLLGAGSLGALSAVLPAAMGAAGGVHRESIRSGRKTARNVIFMVADGMSMGTLTLADACHRHKHSAASTWISLLEAGTRRAAAYTNSADSHVTDSAAGASAWGIGEKVNNSSVGVTPDGRTPTPILVQAAQQGKSTGLVTTTTVTHATPAGFIANVPNRAWEPMIAEQMMDRGFDVILGGGRMHFKPDILKKRNDYTLVRDAAGLEAQRGQSGRLLGLFADSQMAFELDRPKEQPELKDMAKAALDRLFATSNGFVLQIEGGRVDHAAHSNDAAALVHDMLAFDRAVKLVWEMTRERDDTLVIVTTDHGNANPALTKGGPGTWTGVYLLNTAKKSFEWIFTNSNPDVKIDDGTPMFLSAAEGKGLDPRVVVRASKVVELVKQHQGIELDKEQAETLAKALAGKPVDPFLERCSATSVLGSLLANKTGVSFLSANHTSDLVEVLSWGPGSELIKPVIQNTDLHQVIVSAMDLAPAKAV